MSAPATIRKIREEVVEVDTLTGANGTVIQVINKAQYDQPYALTQPTDIAYKQYVDNAVGGSGAKTSIPSSDATQISVSGTTGDVTVTYSAATIALIGQGNPYQAVLLFTATGGTGTKGQYLNILPKLTYSGANVTGMIFSAGFSGGEVFEIKIIA